MLVKLKSGDHHARLFYGIYSNDTVLGMLWYWQQIQIRTTLSWPQHLQLQKHSHQWQIVNLVGIGAVVKLRSNYFSIRKNFTEPLNWYSHSPMLHFRETQNLACIQLEACRTGLFLPWASSRAFNGLRTTCSSKCSQYHTIHTSQKRASLH